MSKTAQSPYEKLDIDEFEKIYSSYTVAMDLERAVANNMVTEEERHQLEQIIKSNYEPDLVLAEEILRVRNHQTYQDEHNI